MDKLILYIEDNAQNMRLIRKMLSGEGYQMLEALDGTTGLNLAFQNRPDLILMDINLPDINGLDVARQLKTHSATANIPIIALTANAMYGDKERFLANGCDGYIAKPVSRRELLTTLTYFLHQP